MLQGKGQTKLGGREGDAAETRGELSCHAGFPIGSLLPRCHFAKHLSAAKLQIDAFVEMSLLKGQPV